jgi:uncharacterized protein YbjT (DUF2867 family)
MTRNEERRILVLGGNGKTGRRVARRLEALGVPVRIGSRAGEPPFDWNVPGGWPRVLRGVGGAYVTYQPDLAVPGAAEAVGAFAELAAAAGVRRLVLLSGRGEEGAMRAEEAVRRSGVEWTVLRSTWFSQNFSEGFFADAVRSGVVALPAGDVREPFVDAEDVADVAAAALTGDGHAGRVYELTGPRLLTFAEAVEEIARAVRRPVRYVQIGFAEYAALLSREAVPAGVISLVGYLMTEVLDGRNAHLADGVRRALGRPPRDFADFARAAAAEGAWEARAA